MAATTTGTKRPGSDPEAEPRTRRISREEHREALLDEALAETFPASDPPSIILTPADWS